MTSAPQPSELPIINATYIEIDVTELLQSEHSKASRSM